MRKVSSIALLLALTACSHIEPGIEVRVVEVPVPQPCLSTEQLESDPALQEPPFVEAMLTGNAETDIDVISASALKLRAWGQTLIAAHRACSESN